MSEPRRPVHAGVEVMVSARCIEKGWTRQEFAVKAGVARASLWRVLEGRVGPTDDTLAGLAKALGMKWRERETLLVPTEADKIRAQARKQGVVL